jgi:hypothetical protein
LEPARSVDRLCRAAKRTLEIVTASLDATARQTQRRADGLLEKR